MKRFILLVKSLLQLIVIILLKPFAFFYRIFSRKKIYVFIERGYDAQDNAYYMYEFYKQKGYCCKYIISKKSGDIEKIDSKDLVYFCHFKHFFFINCAYRIISTHYMTFVPGIIRNSIKKRAVRFYGKIIFLQHGVIKDNLISLHRANTNFDLFICGAKPEYEYIKDNFGYSERELKYTGLARFDYLFNSLLKQKNTNSIKIMIMPTWRKWLNESNLTSSSFYKEWNDLLKDKQFISICDKHNIQISFVPHPEIKKIENKMGKFFFETAKTTYKNIQKEIIESDLLITDYSSVFFDFAYLKKPVIYFQFDEKEFFKNHYQKGYFDYRKMGFGPVCLNSSEVVESIISFLNGNLSSFLERHETFFTLFDNNNRKRIFDAIENC